MIYLLGFILTTVIIALCICGIIEYQWLRIASCVMIPITTKGTSC